MIHAASLFRDPNALAPHYSRFRVQHRLLLTGHSHQAWPDVARDGQIAAWDDAADGVDRKWERAFAVADRVRRGWARLLDDDNGAITLAANTHDLVVRFLSALPLRERPRIVTTDGEFHTLRRQLDRLAEEGIELHKVPSEPAADLAGRLAAAVDDRTAAVAVSCVLYRSAHIVPDLQLAFRACEAHGAELLVDTYHALDVVPFSLKAQQLEGAFVVGGGYKYCQLGEGNCFLRTPPGCTLRPVVTGWFAEFAELAQQPGGGVAYGDGPARFAGATYDPTAHYRAARVFDFFAEHGLTPELLRQVSQHQIGLLRSEFDRLDLDPRLASRNRDMPLARIGGFLALRSPCAQELHEALWERGVTTDYRGDILRFGPAPYLCDRQLIDAMAALGEAARGLSGCS